MRYTPSVGSGGGPAPTAASADCSCASGAGGGSAGGGGALARAAAYGGGGAAGGAAWWAAAKESSDLSVWSHEREWKGAGEAAGESPSLSCSVASPSSGERGRAAWERREAVRVSDG